MKRIALVIAAAASLVACTPGSTGLGGLPAAPEQVADRVVLDEQAAIGVELAYKALRTAIEVATDAGLIRGPRATQMATLDNRAYTLVQSTRAAYRAGNAAGYATAAAEARAAIDQAISAIRGR